jgi:glycosyltransferase involved in cell wall biosynthesis
MISIVIPAFNEEESLTQCIESLTNQDYKDDYEIIVVDNASADGTRKVACKFGAEFVFSSKRGVVYAFQRGAYHAMGDIIAQADAETIYPRNWLSRIDKHFSSHPGSVALAGTNIYREHLPWAWFEYFAKYLINTIGLLFLRRPVYISKSNFAFRRKVFLNVNGYDPRSRYPDRWGISCRLRKVGKISWDKTLLLFTSARLAQKPFR